MPEFWIYSGNNFFKFKYPEETLKNKICSKCIWPETWILFLALNNIHFLPVFEKSLRNNALPTTLPSSLPIFPPISPTLFTLVRRPRWRMGHVTRAGAPAASPSLPCCPHWGVSRVARVSAPSALACCPRGRAAAVPALSRVAPRFSGSCGVEFVLGALGTGL